MERKHWVTPELVAVVRARPEESVLQGCKSGSVAGPVTIGAGCYCGEIYCQPCLDWSIT